MAGKGLPKLSVAMDGDSQASHGRAARSVFWKAFLRRRYTESKGAKGKRQDNRSDTKRPEMNTKV